MSNKKEQILSNKYEVLPADWKKFEHNVLKLSKSLFAFNHDDEGGKYRGIGDHATKNYVAKWYVDSLEVLTDIPKVDFYKMARNEKNNVSNIIFDNK